MSVQLVPKTVCCRGFYDKDTQRVTILVARLPVQCVQQLLNVIVTRAPHTAVKYVCYS